MEFCSEGVSSQSEKEEDKDSNKKKEMKLGQRI
jgi:hypothetical protein